MADGYWPVVTLSVNASSGQSMYLEHLSLTNYRNFTRLDVDLPLGAVVLVGSNAQGKTSFLEAVYFRRPVVWSHPAFANRCIYARNDKEIVCVDLSAN